MKKIISLLICILLLTGCTSAYKTIDSNTAMELIKNNAVVIDVRTAEEYNTGHVKESINIPVDNILSLDFDKDTTIIVYCATGIRSANAAKMLIDAGYTNVYNLDGGLINWGAELE